MKILFFVLLRCSRSILVHDCLFFSLCFVRLFNYIKKTNLKFSDNHRENQGEKEADPDIRWDLLFLPCGIHWDSSGSAFSSLVSGMNLRISRKFVILD